MGPQHPAVGDTHQCSSRDPHSFFPLSDPRLQDLENQYRKEKEEADLLLEQQRLVRGKLGYNRVAWKRAGGGTAGWTEPGVGRWADEQPPSFALGK